MTAPLSVIGANSRLLLTQAASPFDLLPGQSQLNYTFTFVLYDNVTGEFKRTLTPIANTVPQLAHDTTRSIKRQLTLSLGSADIAVINVIRDRVDVALLLTTGVSYSLGSYIFTDETDTLFTSGSLGSLTLMDQEFTLDQPRAVGFPPGLKNDLNAGTASATPVSRNCQFLAQLVLQDFPQIQPVLAPTPYDTSNSWSYGTTSLQILTDLALLGDYMSPWIDNDGFFRFLRTFDPAGVLPSFDWDTYPHVYADSITETNDLLTAPNRFTVVSNSPSTGDAGQNIAIVASYDVPPTAPHSIKNRGFVVPEQLQLQIDTQAQANAMAASIGIQSTIFQRVTLATFPDPRHDSYDVVRWQGDNWLELAWQMDLIAGGHMTHTLRKTYTP